MEERYNSQNVFGGRQPSVGWVTGSSPSHVTRGDEAG